MLRLNDEAFLSSCRRGHTFFSAVLASISYYFYFSLLILGTCPPTHDGVGHLKSFLVGGITCVQNT
jgi:hypothetical protein